MSAIINFCNGCTVERATNFMMSRFWKSGYAANLRSKFRVNRFHHSISTRVISLEKGRLVSQAVRNNSNSCKCLISSPLQCSGHFSGSSPLNNWSRLFCSASDDSGISDGSESDATSQNSDDDGSDSEPEIIQDTGPDFTTQTPIAALSTMTVPDEWPNVPVIAVKRHPVFPRFIKMIEVKKGLLITHR